MPVFVGTVSGPRNVNIKAIVILTDLDMYDFSYERLQAGIE